MTGSDDLEFVPSEAWFADWPYGINTLVQVRAVVSGEGAGIRIEQFLGSLIPDPDNDVPVGTRRFYRGGYFVVVTDPNELGQWQVDLASAGEDGFDSVLSAAQSLTAALAAKDGDVQISWQELAAHRVG